MDRSARFKYNLTFEYVMGDFFGLKHYGGMAGAFRHPDYCKMCLLRVVRKIRKRLDDILTMDERLRQIVGIILDRLEGNVKATSEAINNDWDIIADLLDLIGHLLGYDWVDGRVHRHVVFFQDKTQEQLDGIKTQGGRYYDEWRLEEKRRYMLVDFLKKKQIPKYQIAKLLGISVNRVTKILHEIGEYEKETEKNFPGFE